MLRERRKHSAAHSVKVKNRHIKQDVARDTQGKTQLRTLFLDEGSEAQMGQAK